MSDDGKSRDELLAELERARARERAKQEQWRLFSQATTNLLWNWNFADDTVERSIGFETAFGYPREEILPGVEWWVDRLHGDDRDRVLGVFGHARDAGESQCTYEYRFRRRDGSFAHISDRVFILYDEDHRPVRALGAMTDISDRVRMEAALRESEERFRRAVGNAEASPPRREESGRVLSDAEDALRLSAAIVEKLAQAIIIIREHDHVIAFVNPRAEEMFGYDPGELVGRPVTVLTAPEGESPDGLMSRITRAIQHYDAWRGELENVTKDGRRFWCRATLSALEQSAFGPVYLCVQEDITQMRESTRRQRLITEELDHRVKNNLASILGLATQTARRSGSLDGFLEAFLPRLHAMARVHEALASGGWDELQLDAIIKEAVRLHETAPGQISASGPACALSSTAASALGPALHELATNAVKYGALSTTTGKVRIDWECDPDGGLALRWSELDGPEGARDVEPGFGLTLVRGLVEQQIGGQVRFVFGPGGARHEIRIPGRL